MKTTKIEEMAKAWSNKKCKHEHQHDSEHTPIDPDTYDEYWMCSVHRDPKVAYVKGAKAVIDYINKRFKHHINISEDLDALHNAFLDAEQLFK